MAQELQLKGGSVMEKKSHLTQKQKLDILESAKEIGIKEASDLAGIHYTTVYQWQRKLEVLGDEIISCPPPS